MKEPPDDVEQLDFELDGPLYSWNLMILCLLCCFGRLDLLCFLFDRLLPTLIRRLCCEVTVCCGAEEKIGGCVLAEATMEAAMVGDTSI